MGRPDNALTPSASYQKYENMKRIFGILGILLLLSMTMVACQDFVEEPDQGLLTTRSAGADPTHYYWYNGEKVALTLNNEYVNVLLDKDQGTPSNVSSMFENYQVQDVGVQSGNIIKLKLAATAAASDFSQITLNLRQHKQVKQVLPFFNRGSGEPVGTSDVFYLKLKDAQDYMALKTLAAQKNVEVVKEVPNMPLWYILSIENSSFASAVEASNYFYETGNFDDVDPAFMFRFQPTATPNDPMFGQLWGLKNNSYPGIDVNATAAWDITRGAGAKVAVVDQGIDPNHNDLKANFYSLSYDAQSGTSPSVYKSGNTHGTHVAGTVAAVMNNNLQVVGVAPQSKIIRVSHDLYASSTISAELASGISWAWQNGADVITNSWGDQGGALYGQLQSAILEQAIVNAMTKGRNGLGCVVTFAAGNRSPKMDYPGTFHDDILTVGSIDSNGSRSSFSGYGTKLDVVAPGNAIVSTLPNNGTGSMSGTSMATPHVAGVAALVISQHPTYTRAQVVSAIEGSARKLTNYKFTATSGRPNGTWNDQVGYGLVDAFAAVNYSGGGFVQFFDQIVSVNRTVQGDAVETKNVTVSNNAKLTIIGTDKIILFEKLNINHGSKFEMRRQ